MKQCMECLQPTLESEELSADGKSMLMYCHHCGSTTQQEINLSPQVVSPDMWIAEIEPAYSSHA